MKKVLMMLFAVLLFASCNKEAGEPQPQKEQKHYSLSLDVAASTEMNGYKALDHLNYKFQNGKVKPALVPGEEIEVYTNIITYKGEKIELANGGIRKLKWRVSDDGKKLYCRQTISDLTFNPNDYDEVALIAGIHAIQNVLPFNRVNPLPEDNKVQVFTSTTSSAEAFSMKVPYFLPKVVLKKDAQGVYVNKQLANNKFKPKGYLLKVHVKNELNEPLSLSGVQSCGLVPDYALFPDWNGSGDYTKEHPLKSWHTGSYYPNRKFSFSKNFTVPAGARSSEAFLLWIPEVINNADYLIDLIVKDVPSQAFYVSKLFTKSPSEYVEGNMYTVTLTVRPIRNPLDYLSKYAVNKDGTDFLTNWNDFAPEEPKNFTTKNKEVGYFDGYRVVGTGVTSDRSKALIIAGEEYSYPNGGAGVKWHLPTVAEWNSVFAANRVNYSILNYPVQIGDYKGLFGPVDYKSSGQSGSTYEVYTLCFNPLPYHKITKDRIAGVPKPWSNFPTAGSWYWSEGDDQYRAAFLPEISDNKRYAFYYKYDYTTHMMTIKCKYVGANPEFTTAEDVKNKINWSSVTTSRTIPAYSVKAHYWSHYSGEHHYPDINEIELPIPDAIYLWSEELTLGGNFKDTPTLFNNLACATFGPDNSSLRLRGITQIKGGVFTGIGIKYATTYYGDGWHANQTLYYPVYLFRKF